MRGWAPARQRACPPPCRTRPTPNSAGSTLGGGGEGLAELGRRRGAAAQPPRRPGQGRIETADARLAADRGDAAGFDDDHRIELEAFGLVRGDERDLMIEPSDRASEVEVREHLGDGLDEALITGVCKLAGDRKRVV